MTFFKIDTSDSTTSEETVFYRESRNPLANITNNFFSDTEVVLDSSPDSIEKKKVYPLLQYSLE